MGTRALWLLLAGFLLVPACSSPPGETASLPSPTLSSPASAPEAGSAAEAPAEEKEEEEETEPIPRGMKLVVPPELQGGGEKHPRQDLMKLSPLSALTTRYWVGDTLVFRLALLRALTDEANPLSLTAAEKEKMGRLFQTLLEAQSRIWFRNARVHEAITDRWLSHEQVDDLHEHKVYVEVPEDNFRRVFPVAEAVLASRAGGARAEAAPYPGFTPTAEQWPEQKDQPPKDQQLDLSRTQPIEDLAYMLAVLGPHLEPEVAARSLAELREIQKSVEEMRPVWMALTVMGTRDGRGDYVKALAHKVDPKKEKPYQVNKLAWDYLQRHGGAGGR